MSTTYKPYTINELVNEIYEDNIFLRDWNGEWRGKQAVLEMNENLFVNEFQIDNIQIKQADITTIVQFDSHIADTILRVADIIDWNENGKIGLCGSIRSREKLNRIFHYSMR